jgi:hypothetical protein
MRKRSDGVPRDRRHPTFAVSFANDDRILLERRRFAVVELGEPHKCDFSSKV